MPRASVVVRPGWNEAAHTDVELLHAAAYYEFKTHVEGLLHRGLVAQATRLWASVCPHPIGLGVQGLPPFRRSPCMEENCRRCNEYLGGFKFPWIGTWNSSAVLALPGSDPRLAWQSYYDRLGEAKLDLLLIEPLRTHWTARDFAPDNIFGLVAFIEHNAESMVDLPGSPHVEDGETHPWCPSQLTWLRGEHHGPEQFGRYGAGSVPWRLGRNPCHLARLVGCRRLNSVSDASPPCAVPVHPPNVQDVTPSCVETHLQQLRPSDVFLLPGDTEVWSAVSGPARTLQTLAAVVSGVAMAYHPGAYAVQAASEAPPCAETAMERVAATRVEVSMGIARRDGLCLCVCIL